MNSSTRLFKALSDDTRLRIYGLLLEGELCVCDLMAVLELPQSTVSRHLAYLRNSGLLTDRRQGVWTYYRLADNELPGEQSLRGNEPRNDDERRHGDRLLRQALLTALDRNLRRTPQARLDHAALKKHMSTKRVTACK